MDYLQLDLFGGEVPVEEMVQHGKKYQTMQVTYPGGRTW